MATLNELAYIIYDSVIGGGGNAIFNNRISIEQIKLEIILTRNRLIEENAKQGIQLNLDEVYQTIDCLEFECKDISECCDYKSGRKVLTTDIPSLLFVKGINPVNYFGTIDYSKQFRVVYNQHFYSALSNKILKHIPTLGIIGNKAILVNSPTDEARVFMIRSLFKDPRELMNLSCNCFSEDDNFPIPSGMEDIITGKLINSFMRIMSANTGQENTQSPIK